MIVNFGDASGHPDPLDLLLFTKHELLSVTRPAVSEHINDPANRAYYSEELYELATLGVLNVKFGKTYSLHYAAQVHRDQEGREFTGSLLLKPYWISPCQWLANRYPGGKTLPANRLYPPPGRRPPGPR